MIVKYSSDASAIGRNGWFHNLQGVDILVTETDKGQAHKVYLTPVGKSGKVLNAGFGIPIENVQAFIVALEKETGLEENN